MIKFNDEQIEAILSDGPNLVIAGPGSGKTTVMVAKCAVIFERCKDAKVLVTTFSKKAASDIKEKFIDLCENSMRLTCCTVDSLAYQIVTAYMKDDVEVVTNDERTTFFKYWKSSEDNWPAKIREYISNNIVNFEMLFRENKIPEFEDKEEEQYLLPIYREAVIDYIYYKKICRKFDYADLVMEAYRILVDNDELRSFWQQRFTHIIVDEAQDTDNMQTRLLFLLTNSQKNITLIGDEDQSIYGFRGINENVFKSFIESFKPTIHFITHNYRCPNGVVLASFNLINNNHNRTKKKFISENNQKNGFGVSRFESVEEEINHLTGRIRELLASGVKQRDIAVLCRLSKQKDIVAFNLEQSSLKADLGEERNLDLLEDRTLGDFMAFWRVGFASPQREDYEKVRKVLDQGSNRRVTDDLVKNLIKQLTKECETGRDFVDFVMKKCHYRNYARKNIKRHVKNRIYRRLLLEHIGDLFIKVDKIKFLNQELLEMKNRIKESFTGVNVMTVHGAKGLEFDYVFILDCIDGIVPFVDGVEEKKLEKIEEERRILYVAMTRAKKGLEILTVNNNVFCESRFIKEMKV